MDTAADLEAAPETDLSPETDEAGSVIEVGDIMGPVWIQKGSNDCKEYRRRSYSSLIFCRK